MNDWQPTDELVYRLPTDPPGEWRSAGIVSDLEAEHYANQRLIQLAQYAEHIAKSNKRFEKTWRAAQFYDVYLPG